VEALEEGFDSLLADVILPHSTGTGLGTFDDNLGIELADLAAQKGVRVIAFLTVVPKGEVYEKCEALKRKHPHVDFKLYDKLELLDIINELLEFLRVGDGGRHRREAE
jgi:hypothetical protein